MTESPAFKSALKRSKFIRRTHKHMSMSKDILLSALKSLRNETTSLPQLPSMNPTPLLNKPRRLNNRHHTEALIRQYFSTKPTRIVTSQETIIKIHLPELSEHSFSLYTGAHSSSLDISLLLKNSVHSVLAIGPDWEPICFPLVKGGYKTILSIDQRPNEFLDQFQDIFRFLDLQLRVGSVLVHCEDGKNKSCAVVAAYCMVKYNLSAKRSIRLLNESRSDLEISTFLLNQLRRLGNRMKKGLLSNLVKC